MFHLKKHYPKLSDFATTLEGNLIGERITVDDIIGKNFVVLWAEVRPSKLKDKQDEECLYMHVKYQGKDRVLITSSKELIDHKKKSGDKIPFETTIVRRDGRGKKFFSFA
jgi:hypothetical protein